jgi:hypothetical protein
MWASFRGSAIIRFSCDAKLRQILLPAEEALSERGNNSSVVGLQLEYRNYKNTHFVSKCVESCADSFRAHHQQEGPVAILSDREN